MNEFSNIKLSLVLARGCFLDQPVGPILKAVHVKIMLTTRLYRQNINLDTCKIHTCTEYKTFYYKTHLFQNYSN